jgi:hypothetical protein
MIDNEGTALLDDSGHVICKDENGLYVTQKSFLDSKTADPYRCATVEWRENLFAKMTKAR